MAAGSSVTVAGALSSRAKSIKSKESPDRIVTVCCHRAVGSTVERHQSGAMCLPLCFRGYLRGTRLRGSDAQSGLFQESCVGARKIRVNSISPGDVRDAGICRARDNARIPNIPPYEQCVYSMGCEAAIAREQYLDSTIPHTVRD